MGDNALEQIGSDSRNWLAISGIIGLIVGIIGTGFNFKTRIEKLEAIQAETCVRLEKKVNENVLTIQLDNIKKELDKINSSLDWLIKRGT